MNAHDPRLLLLLSLACSAPFFGCASAPCPAPTLMPSPAVTAPVNSESPRPAAPATTLLQESQRESGRQPWEFTIGGAGSSNQDFDAGGGQLASSVGYYFSEVIELSVRQNISYADGGRGTPAAWNGVTRGALDLHFPLDRFVPYVGVNLGYVYGDTVDETAVAGPEAGIKVYLKDDVFLLAGAEYEFFFDKSDRINDAFRDGLLVYGVGLGIRF